MVRAPQAPRRTAPGPTAAAVALTVRAPQAPRRAAAVGLGSFAGPVGGMALGSEGIKYHQR